MLPRSTTPASRFSLVAILFLSGLSATLLTSCSYTEEITKSSTLKASMDYANTLEDGVSQLVYHAKTTGNVTVFTKIGYKSSSDAIDNTGDEQEEESSDVFGLKGTSIGTGLEYIGKGARLGSSKLNLNYLEVPILLMYDYPNQDKGTFYGGAGPYLAYALSGKYKGNGFSEKAFGKNGDYKRFDAGLELMAGYKLPMGISLDLAYDFGLANISRNAQDFTSHNRCLSLNLGYPLNKLLNR